MSYTAYVNIQQLIESIRALGDEVWAIQNRTGPAISELQSVPSKLNAGDVVAALNSVDRAIATIDTQLCALQKARVELAALKERKI